MTKKKEEESETVTVTIAGLKIKELTSKINGIIIIGGFLGLWVQGQDKPPPEPDDRPVTVQQFDDFREDVLKTVDSNTSKIDFIWRMELKRLSEKKKLSYNTIK
jgi:hypothetical protein